jgi:DNA-binding NarL/FixJ family response regulator
MTLRCVIVDDNADVLRSAQNLLEGQGIAVVGVATTSEQALPLVEELAPDVVLVDIVLGPDSGFELAVRLAERAATAQIVLISTLDESDFRDLIAASPAIGFLAKSALSAGAIRRLLKHATGEDGIERRGT